MGMGWIKMREDLTEDPAVLQMSRIMGERPEHIVGYCHKFWSWVSRQCNAASVTGVTLVSLEETLNLRGFLHAMVEAGWLQYRDDERRPVIGIPHFDRHLSQSSKRRALASERQRQRRSNVTDS